MSILNRNKFTTNRDIVYLEEHTNQEVLAGFLKCQKSCRLELRRERDLGIVEHVLTNFTDETLKRDLSDQQLRGLLVLPDLSEGDGSWTVTAGFTYSALRFESVPFNWSVIHSLLGPRHDGLGEFKL